MRVEKGRDKSIITPGTIIWECAIACPHLFLTVWPLDPQANGVFSSILLSALPLPARLTQARDSESKSNYGDNYDCDLVQPGSVFKLTHLPWALELHLLRPECEPRLLRHSQSLYYSTDVCLHLRLYSQHKYHWCTCLFARWMHYGFPI